MLGISNFKFEIRDFKFENCSETKPSEICDAEGVEAISRGFERSEHPRNQNRRPLHPEGRASKMELLARPSGLSLIHI